VLSGRSGVEFLYELRSYPDWQDIPVIIVGQLSQPEAETYGPAFEELSVSQYLQRQTTSLSQFLGAAEKLLPATVI
jgi:hypothetical protein